MAPAHATLQPGAACTGNAMEASSGNGDEVTFPPPPLASTYSRGVSWGSQSISMLLMGSSNNNYSSSSSGNSSTTRAGSSDELHIFMDTSDREICYHGRPSVATLLSSGTSVVKFLHHDRNHATNEAKSNLFAPKCVDAPEPLGQLTSSPSIQLIRNDSCDHRRIIQELLFEESFNGSAANNGWTTASTPNEEDPLACWRRRYQPRWSTGVSDSPDARPRTTVSPATSRVACAPLLTRTVLSDDEVDSDTGSRSSDDASERQRKRRDGPPRLPSRRPVPESGPK